jgi:hypothetical protein
MEGTSMDEVVEEAAELLIVKPEKKSLSMDVWRNLAL